MVCCTLCLFVVSLLIININDALQNTANIRATWIPVQFFSSITNNSFYSLSQLGISRVYIDVWNNGHVYFKSKTMDNILPSGQGFEYDALSQFIPMANRYNIKVYAWFEYGFMTSYDGINNAFAQFAQSNDWLLGKSNNFYWMNPNLLSVQKFLIGIITDAINGYDITGIQLDDHYACPATFNDQCSVDLMNSVTQYIISNIPKYNINQEKILLSSSPATMQFAYNDLNINVINWMYYGYFNEYIFQLYYSSASSFEQQLDYTINEINKYLSY